MYNLPYYKEKDPAVVLRFVRDHPFAFIAGCGPDQTPAVTQIPVFVDERDGKIFLSGHCMRNNDHHKAFTANPAVLAVFTGAHSYVSASWYKNKQTASTWNYMSVHMKGTMRFLDEKALRDVLKRTTDYFEADLDSGSNYDDLPQDYIDKMIHAIVAFEIEVESVDHVFKLSQNRDQESYENIIQRLNEKGGDGAIIAREMSSRKSQLFNER